MWSKISKYGLAVITAGGILLLGARTGVAQAPIVAYYPSPTVTYVPEVRGLFGQRLVYRPVITAPGPVAVMPAPAVTTYYAPAPAARVTYYAPPVAAPVATYSAGVTSYYAPAAPILGSPPRVTTYYAPAVPVLGSPPRVTTYYAPAAPIVGSPSRVTTYYAPAPVVAPPVTTYYPPLIVP